MAQTAPVKHPCDLPLIVSWYRPYQLAGCIFILFWDLFGTLAFGPQLYLPGLQGEYSACKSVFVLLIFSCHLLVPSYWVLVHLVNSTKVSLYRSVIEVSHGPLPCWYKSQTFAIDQVRYIWVEENPKTSEIMREWNQHSDETCHVKAMLKNGESREIFLNLHTFQEAQQLRQQIRSRLQNRSAYSTH